MNTYLKYYQINLALLTILLFYAILSGFNSIKHRMNISYKSNILGYFNKVSTNKLKLALFLLVFVIQMLLPRTGTKAFSPEMLDLITNTLNENQSIDFPNTFPDSQVVAKWKIKVPMTAYNSEVGQTDDTPCIAARGYDLCAANEENVVAANFLPIGTKIKVPELYGDREFTVVDRMNARYKYKVDFWMKSKADAKKFGVKYATVEVY